VVQQLTQHRSVQVAVMVTMIVYSNVLIVENILSMAVLGAMDTVMHLDIPYKKNIWIIFKIILFFL